MFVEPVTRSAVYFLIIVSWSRKLTASGLETGALSTTVCIIRANTIATIRIYLSAPPREALLVPLGYILRTRSLEYSLTTALFICHRRTLDDNCIPPTSASYLYSGTGGQQTALGTLGRRSFVIRYHSCPCECLHRLVNNSPYVSRRARSS